MEKGGRNFFFGFDRLYDPLDRFRFVQETGSMIELEIKGSIPDRPSFKPAER